METANTPIYQAFEWSAESYRATVPANALTQQANTVRDITGGVGVILGMLERDVIAKDNCDQPIFNSLDAATLLRHCIRSMAMLTAEAERLTEWAGEHATPTH
jgi:hypothetical protein